MKNFKLFAYLTSIKQIKNQYPISFSYLFRKISLSESVRLKSQKLSLLGILGTRSSKIVQRFEETLACSCGSHNVDQIRNSQYPIANFTKSRAIRDSLIESRSHNQETTFSSKHLLFVIAIETHLAGPNSSFIPAPI